jgi:HicA toxin of bacterial toxin-antitoxin,
VIVVYDIAPGLTLDAVAAPAGHKGSHIKLKHSSGATFIWSFHDGVEIGPKMLARIAKGTGLKPTDL